MSPAGYSVRSADRGLRGSARCREYVVLVPVKPPALGKSRLVGLPDDERRALAAAFALDTVAACVAADVDRRGAGGDRRRVVLASSWPALGALTIPDGVAMDLNGTLRQSAAEARRRWPELVPVALTADLPALRAEDLDDALAQVTPGEAAYVADTDGIGTTLYTAPYDALRPALRRRARRCAHDGTGARPITAPLPRLRRDVDDLADLRRRTRARRRAPDSANGPPPWWETARRELVERFFAAFLAGPSSRPSWPAPSWRPSWPAPSSPGPSSRAPSWPAPSSRCLLGRRLLGRCLLGRCLLRGRLLRRRLLRRCLLRRRLLRRAFLAGAFLAAPSWRCLLGRRLLGRRLLRGRLLGGLLGRRLLGRAGRGGGRPRSRRGGLDRQLRQLLGAGDDVLQVLAGGELRHRTSSWP